MMSMTIELPAEVEKQIREEATRRGLEPGEVIARALQEYLAQRRAAIVPRLSSHESRLLTQINLGLPEGVWHRYHGLIRKRRAETLTPDERAELIALTDQVEEANADRIERLCELARLRGASLEAVMKELGIEAPGYG
jgi:hypothetical protein